MEQSPDLVYPYKQKQKLQNKQERNHGIMEQSPDLDYKPDQESQNEGGQK